MSLLTVLLIFFLIKSSCCDYMDLREQIMDMEIRQFGEVSLTYMERKVDEEIVKLKLEELERGYGNDSEFLPATSFLSVKEEVERSRVFQFIKKLPKGASLHTHMSAAVSMDFIIKNLTYMDNVYGCFLTTSTFKLKFLENPRQDSSCSWKSLENYRKEDAEFDQFLKETLTVNDQSKNLEDTWTKFNEIFATLSDLVAYRPAFKIFVHQLLQELYEDNVFYVELRGTFVSLYELNGMIHDTNFFLDTFIETVDEFKRNHIEFIGVKYIACVSRGSNSSIVMSRLEETVYYKRLYPDFIAGFDLVGYEPNRNLVDIHKELIQYSKDLKFFFHAGETTQFGKTDLNLLDAILLNSSRIGHGTALAKHPLLMEMAAQKDIAVELNAISNQVLKLVPDLRNHPGAVLLSRGYPVVICSDDPAIWGATGLSYDWYMVFMSMTWQQHGLQVLKKFAQDSITYSAMDEEEKNRAFHVWNQLWDRFIDEEFLM